MSWLWKLNITFRVLNISIRKIKFALKIVATFLKKLINRALEKEAIESKESLSGSYEFVSVTLAKI